MKNRYVAETGHAFEMLGPRQDAAAGGGGFWGDRRTVLVPFLLC